MQTQVNALVPEEAGDEDDEMDQKLKQLQADVVMSQAQLDDHNALLSAAKERLSRCAHPRGNLDAVYCHITGFQCRPHSVRVLGVRVSTSNQY